MTKSKSELAELKELIKQVLDGDVDGPDVTVEEVDAKIQALTEEDKSIEKLYDQFRQTYYYNWEEYIKSIGGNPTPPPPPPGGGGTNPNPKPTEGTILHGGWGANTDPHSWTVTKMTNPADQFKVVDAAAKNVATNFTSNATAQGYIEYWKWEAEHANPVPEQCPPGQHWDGTQCVPDVITPPGGGGGGTGAWIYKPKVGGYTNNKVDTSQGDCEGDGKRFNISGKKNVINKQTKWTYTMTKEVTSSCTDKPWWSPKVGSHGSTGEPCCYTEISEYYTGKFKSCRTEGPHPSYHSIPSSALEGTIDPGPHPIGKKVGCIAVQYLKEPNYITEFWIDWTNEGNGPYKLLGRVKDTIKGVSGIPPLQGSPGNYQLIGDESNCKDTFRGNGITAVLDAGQLVEIDSPPVPA